MSRRISMTICCLALGSMLILMWGVPQGQTVPISAMVAQKKGVVLPP